MASLSRLDETRKLEKHARDDSSVLRSGNRTFRSVPDGIPQT
jgi:hypothetical protein